MLKNQSDIENSIEVLLENYSSLLDQDTKEFVRHYLTHCEYEMAFEGLFLEVMSLEAIPTKDEIDTYFKLGSVLELDKSSVLDAYFWEKFLLFRNKCLEANKSE